MELLSVRACLRATFQQSIYSAQDGVELLAFSEVSHILFTTLSSVSTLKHSFDASPHMPLPDSRCIAHHFLCMTGCLAN